MLTAEDYNFELPESGKYHCEEIDIQLKLMKPSSEKQN